MENLKNNLDDYLKEILPETQDEFIKLNRINDELSVIMKHCDDKITFTKSDLQDYLDLGFKYKKIEGFKLCVDKLKELLPEAFSETKEAGDK